MSSNYIAPTPVSLSTENLALLAEATRALLADRPLAARLDDLFRLMRNRLTYTDARLTCWLQSAQPGTMRQQFHSPDGWMYPWDDGLTRQIALGGQIVHQPWLPPSQTDHHENGSQAPVLQATYLGAPIWWGGRLWGVLELRAMHSEDFDHSAQEFITALLPQIASAIAAEGISQNQQIVPVTKKDELAPWHLHEHEEQILAVLSSELEGPQTLHQLLTLLLRWSLDATGAEAGTISLVDHERGELITQIYEGYPSDRFPSDWSSLGRQRRSWDTSLAGRVARSGRAFLVRDVSKEANLRLAMSNIRAELAVPISANGQVLAVLVLDSPRSAAFGDAELQFVSALCERAAQPLLWALSYQEALESSTHLGQVFASLPTGLALLDISGRVLRANPSWSAIWGLDPHIVEAEFHVPFDLVEALLSRLHDPFRLTEFCVEGQRAPTEVQMATVRLINPAQELQVLSVPTRDSLEQITGRLWAVSDVTREREVDRLKSEFVSIVSHELRTPLTSILGYTELLLARDFEPADQRQFIKTVYDQATHLSQLVEDLLGVSRLDAGKVKLNRWVVALRQLIAELTNQLNAQLDRHRLLIRLAEPLPPVYVDRDKVKQILFNLLTNAIKYSPQGGEVELIVQETRLLPADHPPGRWLIVSVRDQGIGISPEDLSRIWERFYRVDNTNTRRIGGTGLGLSITRALVELHGGRIWVDSVVEKGSIFSFTLPVATELDRRG
ncbi:MAG: ATP-binding protein [Chloroflexales bacterium]|nr:ATP-binding protein [Chloroflexales bacterium]